MKTFRLPVQVCFGTNALDILKSFQSPFIVADPFFAESPLMQKITQHYTEYTIFKDFTPDPTLSSIANGITKFSEKNYQSILAVGGGSAIDTAKAILLFSIKSGKCKKLPFVVIPTTSGTGSEVTAFSVVTDTETKTKHPLISEDILPHTAILDTEFVKTVPKKIAADTGADVLCHALESYVSTNATPFSDALAEKAIQMVFSFLPKSIHEDLYAKEMVHYASTMAGLAFNLSNLGLCHAMAHNIGARLHLPHGRTNAILLPHIVRFNAGTLHYADTPSQTALKYAHISKLLGNSGTPSLLVKKLINDIERLFQMIDLPKNFHSAGVEKQQFEAESEAICAAALKDGCLSTNPIQPTKQQVEELLKGAF